MGYRVIFIANPCRLSVKNEQLTVDTGETARVPLEDMECLVLDNAQITFNNYLLSKIAEYRLPSIFPRTDLKPRWV